MPEIKIKNREVMGLLQHPVWEDRSLPTKVRYWLSRIFDKLQTIQRLVEKERIAICEQYCERLEDGKPHMKDNQFTFPEGGMEKVNKEIMELLDQDETIPFERPRVDMASPDIKDLQLNPAEMAALEPILEFYDSTEKSSPPTPPSKLKRVK